MTKSIMIQGAGSNVGKSMIVAGLCRAFVKRGLRVAPFKPQNMSNNAAVAKGGEIGRAQALQALACGIEATTDMNPVLLKPQTDIGAQVVVNGQVLTTVKARDYAALKPRLMQSVLDSFNRLKSDTDLVVIEGAGSPAEINLRAGDIANMGFAQAADVPVILVGDIDRGGVIAQMVGTHAVLHDDDLDRIKGFIINKFRGDVSLFDDGLVEIANRTGWHSLGVAPWFADAAQLPAEDASDIHASTGTGRFKIAVPQLSRIANFDDLDPLAAEPDVTVIMVPAGHPLPGDADLILIPGSKSTIGDLAFFKQQGWDIDLAAHVRRGGRVVGICGGYQMLGQWIDDPDGIEGQAGRVAGLGHLDVTTTMRAKKRVTQVTGCAVKTGTAFSGYEIHIGQTSGADCANPWLTVEGRAEGACSPNGQIMGCYVHGLFASDTFRSEFLDQVGSAKSDFQYGQNTQAVLDALAAHLETCLDLDLLLKLAR